MSLDGLLILSFERVVRAPGDDADQEHGQARVRLDVVYGPVLVVVGEVRDGQAVREDHNHLNECVQAQQPHEQVETLLALARIIVERGEEREKQEELEVIREVPGPGEACVGGGPGDQVVQEGQVPQPVVPTLGGGVVHVEEGAVAAEDHQEFPEEHYCKEVEGEETYGTVHIDESNVVLKAILLLDFLEHEEDSEEASHPEEAVDDMLSREDSAENEITHPLLDDSHILQGCTLQNIEVSVSENDNSTSNDSKTIENCKFLVILIGNARRENLRERSLK